MRGSVRIPVLVLLAAFVLPTGAWCVDKIAFQAPVMATDTPAARAAVGDLIDRAAVSVDRLYGDRIRVVPSARDADYTVGMVVSLERDSTALILTLSRDETKTAPLTWVTPLAPDTPLWMARGVFLLWSSFHGYLADLAGRPPTYVAELPSSTLDPYGVPVGIAVTAEGTLAVALGTRCVELDGAFRLLSVPGQVLADRGNMTYAGSVLSTPGGSLVLKPALGRDLYRIQAEGAEPQRIATGMELSTIFYWAALADGSVLLADATNRKAYRVAAGERRRELPLYASESSWPTAYAAGPESTIWVYDPMLRGVRIHTSDGTPADILLPLVDPATILTPVAMTVGPDGSFILLSSKTLYRFRRDGTLIWTLDSLAGSGQDRLPDSAALAADWQNGIIYLADTLGRRVVKIAEPGEDGGLRDELDRRIVALRGEGTGDEPEVLRASAELYAREGSRLMARTTWQRLEESDPGNPMASTRLEEIELEDLRAAAWDLDLKARAALANIGVETARPLSIQAIQRYELLLSRVPDDVEARRSMTELRDLFSGRPAAPSSNRPLTISEVRIAPLFPSLMLWYAANPAGSVTVRNGLDQTVTDVRASVLLPRFMDLAVESAGVPSLAPGETVTLPLAPVFDQRVLELQEDMLVPARVVVTYGEGGGDRETARTTNVTVHRNSALTWDDTRKISSFITPNDDVVAGFAARVLATAEPPVSALSEGIFRAMRIADAVGAYGIAYVQDPDSPITRALGQAQTVDTVRFPRVTLANRTGDCDDTTALMCSLLEAVGIRTAVLTTPGHIFMAFDTGEPAQNGTYLAGNGLEVIAREGSVWIPLETTVLSQGFVAAWRAASELVRQHSAAGPFEFLPLAGMRASYPALPLAPSAVTVVDPGRPAVDRAYGTSLQTFTDTLYTERLQEMEAAIARADGRQAVRLRVRQGVLHALFARWSAAESALSAAVRDDPNLVSAYVNLANVRLMTRDAVGALEVVRAGLDRNRESPLLNLLAARIYADRGETAAAATYFAAVRRAAPDLADRYTGAAAAGSAGEEGRASRSEADLPMVWAADP